MTGSTPPPSVSELKCRLAKAMTLAADPKRNELKALLVEVFDNDAAMCGALTANNAQGLAARGGFCGLGHASLGRFSGAGQWGLSLNRVEVVG
jgi:hypothetical protein